MVADLNLAIALEPVELRQLADVPPGRNRLPELVLAGAALPGTVAAGDLRPRDRKPYDKPKPNRNFDPTKIMIKLCGTRSSNQTHFQQNRQDLYEMLEIPKYVFISKPRVICTPSWLV